MGGAPDHRFNLIVVPFTALGLVLSLVAVALSISQFVIQLQNNSGTVIGTKEYYSNITSHVDAPVFTFCGPIPFRRSRTRCLEYTSGLRPVERDSTSEIDSVDYHSTRYRLQNCTGEAQLREEAMYHNVYMPIQSVEDSKQILGYEVLHCVTFAEEGVPAYLGDGAAKRIFFELEYLSLRDYENYVLRLWDPTELRTPLQAQQKLKAEPTSLYSGKTLTLPYSIPGTAMFRSWVPPFEGPEFPIYPYSSQTDDYEDPVPYGDKTFEATPPYGPLAVRAGISAVIRIQEEGTQALEEKKPVFYYLMNLASLNPEIEYPYTDTSRYVTLAFVWDSDTSFYYQTVLAITNVGMAALLISTISFALLAFADSVAITIDYEERNAKS